MTTPVINIRGIEYELSTKLRVAYMIQGQNAHKPYAEIFSNIDTMPLEKQIEMLYMAFKAANAEAAKTISQQEFLDWYLDNCDLSMVMGQLKAVIGGILGQDLDKPEVETLGGSKGN